MIKYIKVIDQSNTEILINIHQIIRIDKLANGKTRITFFEDYKYKDCVKLHLPFREFEAKYIPFLGDYKEHLLDLADPSS